VQTVDGIVTLSGRVTNILAKERSARVAETVKEVRSVVNRVNVSPSQARSDDTIEADIKYALLADQATEAFEIDVSVENGEAKLEGTVESYQEQELVKQVAKGVRGVTEVDDQIEIDYATERSDSEIKKEIEAAFRWDTHLDHYLIAVTVDDGKVGLSGVVGSAAEKRIAKNDAWVLGVTQVDTSQLEVERWARDDELRGQKYIVKSDSELQEAIEDALLFDPRVASFEVETEVDNGIVTLRGEVNNLEAKRAAEQDARHTVGVANVINRIKVRPEDAPSDTEIANAQRGAFLRDPYVERFDITTSVIDGTAYLYGTVDSYFEKRRAGHLASRTFGVVEVENFIDSEDVSPTVVDPYVDPDFVDREVMEDYEVRSPYLTDAELKDEIEDEIWWSPFVDSDEVTVTVDNGVATLTGTVDSWSERESATENAYEGGATLVDNEMLVDID